MEKGHEFGTWNVRSLYRSGSLTAAARELARCKLDLVGVQIRWEKGRTERVGDYTGCPRKNVQCFGRVFLMLNYTDVTQNTYIQS